MYAHELQELLGGASGEVTAAMQYLFQRWNCRMPGKYKDLIMDIAVLGGMDPQQAIVAEGGALLADSSGYPWNDRYIVANGNLLADLRRRSGPGADRPALQHERRSWRAEHAEVQPRP